MNSNPSGKPGMGAGKEEKRIPFLCLWVTWFGKFIAPKRYHEAGAAEVEAFLRSLEEGGAEGWKVTQGDEAIQALYTKMYPVPSVLETRSPIQRPQVAKG